MSFSFKGWLRSTCTDDECVPFNRGNRLWYNAYADHVYDGAPSRLRYYDWYLTVCHELAHNFQAEHDEVFSDYMSHIALQHSKHFHDLCVRDYVDT